jgi:putative FmdB family regulatory protein
MPLFEYSCSRCGEKREVLARSAEAAQAPSCPVCGEAMQKDWAPVAAHTKAAAGCGPSRGGFS